MIIFIRNPEAGKVKTRLARTLGDLETLRIYLFLLEKTRGAASGVSAERHVYYSENMPLEDDWPAGLFLKKLQSAGDLGQRMEAAFYDAFRGGAQKVLIIGSDCPELSSQILENAFEMLEHSDFVLGPVPDGGYYLLGMKEMTPAVFRGITWSTETVRNDTLLKIRALGKSCSLLPELTDIDEAKDWAAYLARREQKT